MINALLYDSSLSEQKLIYAQMRELAALLTEESWNLHRAAKPGELKAILDKEELMDIACYDITGDGAIASLVDTRKTYEKMKLMVIVDSGISPMEYVRPDIMASSLVIRPIATGELKQRLRDLILSYLSEAGADDEAYFVIETDDGKTRIPYASIYYFEARNKKIYVRIGKQELATHGTLDSLDDSLPDTFVRCHRSFLVNRLYIRDVRLSMNEIELSSDMIVPLSRSYKPLFKA